MSVVIIWCAFRGLDDDKAPDRRPRVRVPGLNAQQMVSSTSDATSHASHDESMTRVAVEDGRKRPGCTSGAHAVGLGGCRVPA